MCFYETVDHPVISGNTQWNTIIRNFSEQWNSLKERKDSDIEVPKVTQVLNTLKWVEAFNEFLHLKIGSRTIPLAYVAR